MQTEYRKYLVIVPHPDDEINVAGQLIYRLTHDGSSVTVLYTTNGDYLPGQGPERLKEAIRALKILGVDEKDILFMGYGDDWKGSRHLYNADGGVPLESAGGHLKTYGLENHPDYRFQKSGFHHTYTRDHYKKDLRDILLDLRAQVLIAVDFDWHPDHRCTSLMLEEVLGEILKSGNSYHPLVLKKFAYAGVWNGPKDYFHLPEQPTLPPRRALLNDSRFELDVPAYSWNERIRLSVPSKTRTLIPWQNVIYQALREHRSQAAKWRFDRICSADLVYWFRSTKSLSYRAKIKASSGNPEYLNDFKLIDCPDLAGGRDGIGIFGNCVWSPGRNDPVKSVEFTFPEPVNISCFCLYENFAPDDHVKNGIIRFDNGFCLETGPLDNSGKRTIVEFETQTGIRAFSFQITDFSGDNPGLTEFEVYEKREDKEFPNSIFERYSTEKESGNFIRACFAGLFRSLFESGRFVHRAKERLRRNFARFTRSV
ncbi:GlcNAc-PI de-N-acetylase [Caprobacter fermentans]|uniref:GlcNAc-PI de-N-acetylase n=1 Tax=Caproicibacter fermentans TaxID=2576756 RepID=A0A6N8HYY9_9FIRM|nr:PIG-L family deacetylase [Caproicibacter fermentans]MVB10740.1 GlcNAc-PI de-N-acetylase [Caproicibacter fermentans]